MKKIVISLLLILIISTICFIPLTQQKTVTIKAPFLKVYSQLVNAGDWEKWQPYLRKVSLTDSNKINIKKNASSFSIVCNDLKLNVEPIGNLVNVTEQQNHEAHDYTYTVLPGKVLNKTSVMVSKNIRFINYLIGKLKPVSFADTHIDDFKNFMETDSLYYGYSIFKTKVPESNLIVIRKAVSVKNKFPEAAKMFNSLQQYININHIKQMQPVIAQFISKGKDSVQVNVGLFIDKEVKTFGDINFVHMPKGGPLYAAKFHGQFNKREKVYLGLQQYFADHSYQSAILPFETYLDNKLPSSDTEKINIQLNFTTYF